jgi:hypothetical protein
MRKLYLSLMFCLLPVLVHAETMTYNIKQFGINFGKATLTIDEKTNFEGKPAVMVHFKADGFNFYDEEKIYLNPETYKPFVVLRDLNILGNKEKITEHYSNGKIEINKEAGGKKTKQTLNIKGDVDNIYGFIYRYRKQGSFKKGDTLDVVLPTQKLKIKLIKETKFNAMGKNFDTFYMESEPAQYKIWFDAGEKKLPLRINGSVGAAGGVMTMTDYKE